METTIPAPIKSTNTTKSTNNVSCVQFNPIAKAKHIEDTEKIRNILYYHKKIKNKLLIDNLGKKCNLAL